MIKKLLIKEVINVFELFRRQKPVDTKEKEESKSIEVKLSKQQQKQKEQYIKEVMSHTKLPIVVLDPSWYNVKPLVKSQSIDKKEHELLEVIKEQGTLTNRLKENAKVKQNLMQEVLVVSGQLNENGDETKISELNKLHQAIVKLNEQLKEDESRIEKIAEEIQSINDDIVEEVVTFGYEYMEICKMKSTALENEIDQLRQEVLKKTNEKKQYDESRNILYQYLHNMVGYKHIDKVDQLLGDK